MPGPLAFLIPLAGGAALGFVAAVLWFRPELVDRAAHLLEGPQHKWRADGEGYRANNPHPVNAPRVVPPRHLRVVHHPYDWREEGA